MSTKERQALLASGDLLSIAEASSRTPYSPEYLSFLARTGKLPAVKIARNWLTTVTAVKGYVEMQQQRHQAIIDRLKVSAKEAG